MSKPFDKLLNMIRLSDEDDYDDYDDYDEFDDYDDDDDDFDDIPAPVVQKKEPVIKKKQAKAEPKTTKKEKTTTSNKKTTSFGSSSTTFGSSSSSKSSTSSSSRSSKIVPLSSNKSEVCVLRPTTFEESRDITDVLLNGKAVVINLEGIDFKVAQRIIDFMSGAIYAMAGNIEKISNYIFILTPESIDISGDISAAISSGVNLYNDF